MNFYFDKYVSSRSILKLLIQQYEVAIKSKFEKEREEDYLSNYLVPSLLLRMKFEELSLVYTINIFKKVEEEVKYLVECNATFLKEEREVAIFELKMILVDEQRGTKCYSIQIP